MQSQLCRKATPVLYVTALAPSLDFWRDRLGFEVSVEVPGEDGSVFVALTCNGIELMYQTIASQASDVHAQEMTWRGDRGYLFLEVTDIDAVVAALDGCEVVSPRHETFYGATEVAYREPGGHFVTFAQFCR